MPQKESFTDRINYFKQQAENQKQIDLVTRQQQQQKQDLEREKQKREEEERKQQEIREKTERTKENFAGTGIIEAFQELIDKKILANRRWRDQRWVKGLFGEKLKDFGEMAEPAFIEYEIQSVTLKFNKREGDSCLDSDSGYGAYHWVEYDYIKIDKLNESTFKLSTSKDNNDRTRCVNQKLIEPLLGNSEETVNNIAKTIIEHPTFFARL